MAIEVTLPRQGWSMEEAAFVEWFKKDGDSVKAGEPLFAVETDKTVQEIESLDTGILRILPYGAVVEVIHSRLRWDPARRAHAVEALESALACGHGRHIGQEFVAYTTGAGQLRKKRQHRGIAPSTQHFLPKLLQERGVVHRLRGAIDRIARRAIGQQSFEFVLRSLRHGRHGQTQALSRIADLHAHAATDGEHA